MKRALYCGAAAWLAVAPFVANAECFTDTEWRAAHVRVLQTELQVAALECANVAGASYNDQYTAFIGRFQDRLKANATILKAHFQRVFGKSSAHELDAFVTRVANEASDRSMKDVQFCANSAKTFSAALQIDKPVFETAAVDRVTDHNEVGSECPAKAAVVPAVHKTAAKPAVVQTASAKKPAKKTPPTTANAG